MKNLKTLLNEAIPPPEPLKSNGDANKDAIFKALLTFSRNFKLEDANKQQEFDIFISHLIQLIKKI